ncbi:response regulator [Nonomuraea turcica]|uniref:response regulator n=1 Tax=Nonomuraea sp. G32 TaxID=3067274 RepID=UPI00273C8FB1|nr:response regulator transcription factor [Nonomuraea sp. G32]MDP4511728.1 response regulator transcription factor [Nonomuraea sp. G32]
MIRVLLADDQRLVRSGLAMLLAAEPDIEIVGEAGGGEEAVEETRRLRPHVVVMDVRMPDVDGVAATGRITADGFCDDVVVSVLILTTYHVDEAVYASLRAGASGFLLKDAAPKELAAAIRALADGQAWLDPAVARRLIDEFAARPPRRLPAPAEMRRLTAREREVLALVALGLSNSEAAELLTVSEATIRTHFGRVLMKLNLRDRAQAVAAAYQTGLVVPGVSGSAPES